MTKTDKKRDKQLRELLTGLCEQHCKIIKGFSWLTHHIDWKNPQASVTLTVVFDNDTKRDAFISSGERARLERVIQISLKSVGLNLKNAAKQLRYDTEEQCQLQHQGNWAKRLN
ncbi:Fis family transcriptional regulator [Pseudoalteromonas sp. BDTF-M6]|uniref:Fis family transcriptional regulator n=1 Tax=Pseudoalteromonas sp. BDTF-M6 TaxID=2796132 RepID=UPI001BAF067A|nr:Fis family transcriptional regulator [Pseudoalteromonas sp. BDTF-M6]MBS3798887.1 Fis family transcriptional regulator [Pseudoalteromonas sp. BDTF-M6]